MQPETSLLRTVGEHFPQMVPTLIGAWGTRDFGRQVEELLRGVGKPMPAEVTAALAELRTEHERRFPQFGARPDAVPAPEVLAANDRFRTINARFPHIGQQIVRLWGTAAFSPEMSRLLNDTRNGTRKGFPEDVALALFNLLADHDKAHPELVVESTDIWSLALKE